MARNILIAVLVLMAQHLFGQVNFYPTNWYTGMKWNKVELLVRSERLTCRQFHSIILALHSTVFIALLTSIISLFTLALHPMPCPVQLR